MTDDFAPRSTESRDDDSPVRDRPPSEDPPASDGVPEEDRTDAASAAPPAGPPPAPAPAGDRPWQDRPREEQPHEDFSTPPSAPTPDAPGSRSAESPSPEGPSPASTAPGPAGAPGGSDRPTPREGPGPVAARPSGDTSPVRTRDPNVDAIARAGLAPDVDNWLREVASQVDPRLDRVAPGWRGQEQSGAARACVFGLMLGRLANDYPHTSGDLSQVAEAHPSFATLDAGSRLTTLREIAGDRNRGAAWVAPLVDLDDPSPLRDILE